jgi:hypothetical protein
MREGREATRFQAHVTDDGGSFREAAADIFESDNLDDILAWSSAQRLIDVVASGADDQRVTIERLFLEDGYGPDEQRGFLAAIDPCRRLRVAQRYSRHTVHRAPRPFCGGITSIPAGVRTRRAG